MSCLKNENRRNLMRREILFHGTASVPKTVFYLCKSTCPVCINQGSDILQLGLVYTGVIVIEDQRIFLRSDKKAEREEGFYQLSLGLLL